MSTRSLPTAATETPNRSPGPGVGLVKVVSNVPLVLNRYSAAPRTAAALRAAPPLQRWAAGTGPADGAPHTRPGRSTGTQKRPPPAHVPDPAPPHAPPARPPPPPPHPPNRGSIRLASGY